MAKFIGTAAMVADADDSKCKARHAVPASFMSFPAGSGRFRACGLQIRRFAR
ncbi:hypothetical protein [Thauera sinica]|uniref:Uncharacterized protein n=1 Tax=Thauera sinica TaxID=2665146 RepID=A0ABW1ALV7_9RHOO|nr:hypothetical protein [Thauera sp. K11]